MARVGRDDVPHPPLGALPRVRPVQGLAAKAEGPAVTRREARRVVWLALAKTLENDVDFNGAGWIYSRGAGNDVTLDDKVGDKIAAEARDIVRQLYRKAGR